MRKLQASLRKWDGWGLMEDRLIAKGYRAHHIEWDAMASFCKTSGCPAPSREYWKERALEIVRSGGLNKPDRRLFEHPDLYRSIYLDNIALNRNSKNIQRELPYYLDECYQRWVDHKKVWSDAEAFSIRRAVENRKSLETTPFEVTAWNGTRQGAARLFATSLRERGFITSSSSSWDEDVIKDAMTLLENKIIFQFAIRKGKYNILSNSIDIMFRLSHVDEADSFFQVGGFSTLIPFVSSYRVFTTSKSALVGIGALSTMIIAFVDSISRQDF